MLELGLALLLGAAPAPQAPPPPADITAKLGVEDGKQEVIATVMADGKPVPNAGVAFTLVRTFGDLPLGQDTTLDDGTAAAPFPGQLRPEAGQWTLKVSLTSPEAYAGQARTLLLSAPPEPVPPRPTAPRELWSRSAPWSVLITVLALVGGAWAAFGYAAHQLRAIRREGRNA